MHIFVTIMPRCSARFARPYLSQIRKCSGSLLNYSLDRTEQSDTLTQVCVFENLTRKLVNSLLPQSITHPLVEACGKRCGNECCQNLIKSFHTNVLHLIERGGIASVRPRFVNYFLAKEIFMECEGVILKPCNESRAAADCASFSNSTNAISCLPGTRRTSLKPGNWLNSIDNIIWFVSSGRLVRKRIWLGGASGT